MAAPQYAHLWGPTRTEGETARALLATEHAMTDLALAQARHERRGERQAEGRLREVAPRLAELLALLLRARGVEGPEPVEAPTIATTVIAGRIPGEVGDLVEPDTRHAW